MRRLCLAVIGLGVLVTAWAAKAGTYSVLYQFGFDPNISQYPVSLAALPSGSLVGMASSASQYAVIFKLDPPAVGQTAWTYSVIFDTRDFPVPNQFFGYQSQLLVDATGNVYGGSQQALSTLSDSGTIYRLSPPATTDAKWTCTVLYHHYTAHGTDMYPALLVSLDHDAHHLYGAGFYFQPITRAEFNYLGESLFRLDLPDPKAQPGNSVLTTISPPIFSVLANTTLALVAARDGAFYGSSFTDFGNNFYGVFKLTPPPLGGSQGQLQQLTTGVPNREQTWASIVVDASDNITGIGLGGGVKLDEIWRVSPPAIAGGAWQSSVLYRFKGSAGQDGSSPQQIVSHDGLFYGITNDGGRPHNGAAAHDGTLFELAAPPAGSIAAEWSERVLHTFGGKSAADGAIPRMLTPVTGSDGTYTLYGVTPFGGSADKGTIFRYVP